MAGRSLLLADPFLDAPVGASVARVQDTGENTSITLSSVPSRPS